MRLCGPAHPRAENRVQVARPGLLEIVARPVPSPGPGEVLIAVEACGICGADISDIENADPARQLPRVPGHGVVGRIVALGEDVASLWKRASGSASGGSAGIAVNARHVARVALTSAATSRHGI